MDYLNDNINLYMEEFEEALNSAVEHTKIEFANIRTGRVNPIVVEKVTVEYYGTTTPLRDLATINNEDARTLVINPWDVSIRAEVCRALGAANLGANPIDNGQCIRMIFPALTEERRKEIVKDVKAKAEQCRTVMRNERRDVLDKVKKTAKTDKISEDDVKSIETDVQKLLDSYISNLDAILAKKEVEIMEI